MFVGASQGTGLTSSSFSSQPASTFLRSQKPNANAQTMRHWTPSSNQPRNFGFRGQQSRAPSVGRVRTLLAAEEPTDHKHASALRQLFAFTTAENGPLPQRVNKAPKTRAAVLHSRDKCTSSPTTDKPRYTPISHINDNGLLV